MVVRLSDKDLNPLPYITKADILERYSAYELYQIYIPGLMFGIPISSPLRKGDSRPSFSLFKGESGAVLWKDHGTGKGGDIFAFLGLFWNTNFVGVLNNLVIDLSLDKQFRTAENKTRPPLTDFSGRALVKEPPKKEKRTIEIEERDWSKEDLEYWNRHGVKLSTLRKYRVVPISVYRVKFGTTGSYSIHIADKLAYAFMEKKGGEIAYKIYQPYNKENKKWRTTQDSSTWHGWEQLPEQGHELIITKSLKDVMAIVDTLGVPSVSMQSETAIPKPQVMQELFDRFHTIYLLYDNDYTKKENAGQIQAKKLIKTYPDLINLQVRQNLESKDFSELCYNWTKSFAKKQMLNFMKNATKCPF